MHISRAYTVGCRQALRKLGMDLEFDNPEQAATHYGRRRVIGDVTGVAGTAGGGALGAIAGLRYAGAPGAAAGAAAGALLGNKLVSLPATTFYDTQHDVRQRTAKHYNQTRNLLNAAAGIPPQQYL